MTDAAIEHFEGRASGYEQERRRVVPSFDAFYGAAVEAVGLAGRDVRRVLDLGAGTGLLAAHVLAAYPDAQLTLLDGSAGMLDRARKTFGERAAYVQGDLADPLPDGGPWDAIVSALAIHHLDDANKRHLFARAHAALSPGGMFVNAEQVAGPSAIFDDLYGRWHARRARAQGTTDAEWKAALESMRHDRTASVEHQLTWLHEAGFADADCLWKDHRLAVIAARRAG
ncbi:MAG: class I SAM-dependent methyltransferase [Solirubrobacteraceae bacterium]|jgi:tRNA (cmo5U34)-methyltransferase